MCWVGEQEAWPHVLQPVAEADPWGALDCSVGSPDPRAAPLARSLEAELLRPPRPLVDPGWERE